MKQLRRGRAQPSPFRHGVSRATQAESGKIRRRLERAWRISIARGRRFGAELSIVRYSPEDGDGCPRRVGLRLLGQNGVDGTRGNETGRTIPMLRSGGGLVVWIALLTGNGGGVARRPTAAAHRGFKYGVSCFRAIRKEARRRLYQQQPDSRKRSRSAPKAARFAPHRFRLQ